MCIQRRLPRRFLIAYVKAVQDGEPHLSGGIKLCLQMESLFFLSLLRFFLFPFLLIGLFIIKEDLIRKPKLHRLFRIIHVSLDIRLEMRLWDNPLLAA